MRLLFPHGLGDVIQAIPSFKRFAEKTGEPIDVGVLARLPACAEALARLPFVKSTFGVEDPWNDFEPANAWAGFRAGMLALAEKHNAAPVWTSHPMRSDNGGPAYANPLSPLVCKAARVADELGVEFDPDEAPSLLFDQAQRDTGLLWSSTMADGHGFALIHFESGNPTKDVHPRALSRIVVDEVARRAAARGRPLPSGTQMASIPVRDKATREPDTLSFHAGVLDGADVFVGVDSGPAHLASTIVRDVVWVFTTTPIEQAVPLWRDVRVVVLGDQADALIASWEAWRCANAALVRHEVLVERGAA